MARNIVTILSIMILITLTTPTSVQSSKLLSSIDKENLHDFETEKVDKNEIYESRRPTWRKAKTFPFYSHLYQPISPFLQPYPAPIFYPREFYEDFDAYYNGYQGEGDDENVSSRKNMIPSRRPIASFKNSPVYYVRLPPTPYMFVPGIGYVPRSPSFNPISPPAPPMPMSPFYHLPINFLANGKPSNIYTWGATNYPYTQAPVRPVNPYAPISPMNPYMQEDSKVTNLKGPFLFNGRPEEIYLLQSLLNSVYPDPRFANPYY
jgi:hypothetical protein